MVLTDSGGLQEETTALGVPCITIRENTERPVTVEEGTNVLAGTDPARIVAEARKVLRGEGRQGRRPHLWDGKAAQRIVAVLAGSWGGRDLNNGLARPLSDHPCAACCPPTHPTSMPGQDARVYAGRGRS